jgi:hypothetical protein
MFLGDVVLEFNPFLLQILTLHITYVTPILLIVSQALVFLTQTREGIQHDT